MKRLMQVVILAGLLLAATPLMAADVDGNWSGAMETPQGNLDIAFKFMADGTTLNGSTTGPDGAETKISDGKVNGNDISFTVTIEGGPMPFTINYTGKVMGDKIDLTLEIFGMPLQMSLSRT